jgi:hypothetical protein
MAVAHIPLVGSSVVAFKIQGIVIFLAVLSPALLVQPVEVFQGMVFPV